ncbi:hypothetical protein LguiB_029982 [Lonicera macranthoides]
MHPVSGQLPSSLAQTLDHITNLLSRLIPSSISIKSFTSRWQVLQSKLSSFKSSITEISESPHWSKNPLIQTLLPNLLSTLHNIKTLSDQCYDSTYNAGKLLMQSDLDMATGWLSKQIHDIDLLLISRVLCSCSASLVAKEANVGYLTHLFDLNAQPCLQEQAVTVVSILASASD